MDILLDTSPIIAHLRRRFDVASAAPKDALLFTSLFTVGEPEKGIRKAGDPSRERAKVETFLKASLSSIPTRRPPRPMVR